MCRYNCSLPGKTGFDLHQIRLPTVNSPESVPPALQTLVFLHYQVKSEGTKVIFVFM